MAASVGRAPPTSTPDAVAQRSRLDPGRLESPTLADGEEDGGRRASLGGGLYVPERDENTPDLLGKLVNLRAALGAWVADPRNAHPPAKQLFASEGSDDELQPDVLRHEWISFDSNGSFLGVKACLLAPASPLVTTGYRQENRASRCARQACISSPLSHAANSSHSKKFGHSQLS
ncbi:hypothetical protein BDY21DRAFT_365749 [Lineolata rhizophorae]|uniref:Uncharacterized protein n=1 Tax=Lineolata rhizophorae TaxID=578093 RepID=A0A6A6NTP5_9PEZI|nr:hypothetical protein BDY21DRAFT_365749 [Lineolata rhizophorae]